MTPTPIEQLAAEYKAVVTIIGPPPAEPVYRDVPSYQPDNPATFDGKGIHTSPDQAPVQFEDPENARLEADYQAKLAAYNQLLQTMLTRLTQIHDQNHS
jgi:hypothetical protein